MALQFCRRSSYWPIYQKASKHAKCYIDNELLGLQKMCIRHMSSTDLPECSKINVVVKIHVAK